MTKALESAGIKLGSVASDITGVSATAMIESLIDGERRGAVLADLARGRMRTATRRESPEQKQAWLQRQLQNSTPGCTVTITVSPPEAALPPGA